MNSSSSDESSESEDPLVNFDEEEVIRFYFNRGFNNDEIRLFLSKHHNYEISYSTLLRRLKAYGLKRRSKCGVSNLTLASVRNRITELINGPASSGGYRTVWHSLELEGVRVP